MVHLLSRAKHLHLWSLNFRFAIPLNYANPSTPVYSLKLFGVLEGANDDSRLVSAAWFAQAQKVIDRTRVLNRNWDILDIKLGMLSYAYDLID